MVLTRGVQGSATPSPAPSPLPVGTTNSQNGRKVTKELQRLLIDGNEKMGGAGSSPPKRSRRSDGSLQQSPSPAAARAQPPKGHHHGLGAEVVPPTPPLSDKDAPMRPPPPRNPSPARRKSQAGSTPAAKTKGKSRTPKPSSSANPTPTPSKKRTIHDYFSVRPPESDSKRRKVDSQTLTGLAIQQPETTVPSPKDVSARAIAIPTTEAAPVKEGRAEEGLEPQQKHSGGDDEHVEGGPKMKAPKVEGARPDAALEEEEDRLAEGARPDAIREKKAQPAQNGRATSNITMTREMKRLQIDAKAALLGASATADGVRTGGKRKRRHTAALTDTPAPAHKRPRPSLPATNAHATPAVPAETLPASSPTSSSSSPGAAFPPAGTSWIPAPTAEQAEQIDRYVRNHRSSEPNRSWKEITADLPTRNPTPPPTARDERILAEIQRRNDVPKPIDVSPGFPAWRKNNESTFLASGEVNPAWVDNWLDYVSAICDGPSLEEVPLEARLVPNRTDGPGGREEAGDLCELIPNSRGAFGSPKMTRTERLRGQGATGAKATHATSLRVTFDDTGVDLTSNG